MSKNFFVALCAICLVVGAVTIVEAERPKPPEKLAVEGPGNLQAEHAGPAMQRLHSAVQTKAPKNRVVGVIQYDDGVMTGVPAVSSNCFGNQFNSALGGSVNANGTVTQVQFYMASVAGSAAFVSIFGPVVGTAAPVLTSVNVPGLAAGTWNTHNFATAVSYTGSSFLAGVWAGIAVSDAVGLGTGTTASQGMHGMRINDIAGTGFTAPGTFNALVRAGGDVLVPVELMSFSVE